MFYNLWMIFNLKTINWYYNLCDFFKKCITYRNSLQKNIVFDVQFMKIDIKNNNVVASWCKMFDKRFIIENKKVK